MPTENGIKLIACDMDGTLLDDKGAVSPGNARALREAAEAGVLVCVASGRPIYDIDRLMGDVGVPYGYLSLNGALRHVGGLDARHPLEVEHLEACISAAEREGIAWLIFTQEREYVDSRSKLTWRSPKLTITPQEALGLRGQVLKMIGVAVDGDPQALQRAKEVALEAGLSVSSSSVTNYEVNAPGVNKGAALEEAATALGFAREEVMALGDYENDREMLAWAGCSVAMGNALPHIAALARYQTATNQEDGVAQAIRRWAL